MDVARKVMILRLFVVALCLLVPVKAVMAATQEIVAVVNEDAITAADLGKRLSLIMASSGLPNNPEIRQKLAPQVLNGLIEEQLMLQEARKMKLDVSAQEIEGGYATIAQQNKMDAAKFKGMLQKGGLDLSTMERQIKAQIAWGKVVQAKLRPKVMVSERDVDAALSRIKSKVGATEYLAAEIFLPVGGKNTEDQALQLANRMVGEINKGKASFFKLAQQFSKSAGSAKGGDVGWLRADQLSPEFVDALKGTGKNQVTKPIRTTQGVHILFVRDTRALSDSTVPSKEQIYNDLGTERLDRLQRSYLRDLRASSFVDIRA
jgi:peptidyl-prolyl cis-trans isomerase SurA